MLAYVLLRIKYLPLPPIERGAVRYEVRDVGTNSNELTAFYDYEGRYSWQLTDDSQIIFDDANGPQKEKIWKQARSERATKLGLSAYYITAIKGTKTLTKQRNQLELWQNQKLQASCRARIEAYPKWPVYDAELSFFGANSDIIGNGRIATAPASSGGASSPHGRLFPIIWNGKGQYLRDLNSAIDAKNGWYLHRAVAVNKRGQILCLGEKTDALGAEKFNTAQFRQLILTPLK